MSERQITPGYYSKCRAIAGSEQYSVTATGTEQIAIDIEMPSVGKTTTTFLFFSEKAAPYSIERLRACGWKGDDLSNLMGIDSNEIDVQVKYETFDGKERMKVDIATGGGGRIRLENQMSEKQKREFAARMKSVLRGNGSAAPIVRTAAPALPILAGDPADDLPF